MTTTQFILTIEHTEGDVVDIVTQYLTEPTYPFRDDYAPPEEGDQRSDNYPGPFITGVQCEAAGS